MPSPMLAYHGDKALKAQFLKRIRAHAKADEIIHGIYWEDGKGCAVGCTMETAQHPHARYETVLGIPRALAYLEDRIFEGMVNGRAKLWPAQFLHAIRVGADLSGVLPRFLLALQERRYAALDKAGLALVGPAMQQVIAVLRTWADTGRADESAASAAWSAENAAASAAASAAWSAASAAASAENAAASAAASAAWSAASAAASAENAAASAENAAASAAWSAAWSAENAAASAAWSAEYEWQADMLLTLLRSAR